MKNPGILAVLAGVALAAAPLVALAQAKGQASNITYRCTGKDGKKYYGSAIPPQCYGQPLELLNSRGLVVKRIDPEGDERAKAEKAAALAKQQEESAAAREETRRNRALLATYTSERDIEDQRARALKDNQRSMSEVEGKIDALKKKRAGYDKELELYKDKPTPANLTADIKNVEIDLKAQEDLLAVKKKEVVSINARYDEDKRRYKELTRPGK
jgi:hypothetical protein